MTQALPSLPSVMHEIRVSVVSAEEASVGVAGFWSGVSTQAKGTR